MISNAIRKRAAVVVAAVLVLAVCLGAGSRLTARPAVQIEFGAYPEVFQGMTVEIDGKSAGTLRATGSAHRTGFEVTEGRHTVRVVHPLYTSITRSVDVRAGRPEVLILDLQPTGSTGRLATAIGWQN